jgi:hypothetical protein
MSWLAPLIAFLRGLASDWLARMERDRTHQDIGAAAAQRNLDAEIKDAADEQAKINAATRSGAADVLGRMRKPPANGGTGL